MKKSSLFILSVLTAILISFYNKKSAPFYSGIINQSWKTYEKKNNQQISFHKATADELDQARIPLFKREIAQLKGHEDSSEQVVTEKHFQPNKNTDYLYREDRILIGDNEKKNYQDEKVNLEMINMQNPNWKDILGNELIRFQNQETKVMVKDEHSVIKIKNAKGQYLEQVMITYLFKNGSLNSFRALIDSETGSVLETWDKAIQENDHQKSVELVIPLQNESGIITR
jgi:hypothetical protein